MKRTILTLCVAVAVLAGSAKSKVITNPDVEYTPGWVSVYEVELADEATILRCKLNPGSQIMSNTVLVDRNTGKEHKLLKVEGVAADTWVNPQDGSSTDCTLFFAPVGKNVKEVNLIGPWTVKEHPEDQMYGISLVPRAKAPKKKAKEVAEPVVAPDTTWQFSNERYKDLSFYKPGKALLRIHIERIPRELRKWASGIAFSASYEDPVLGNNTSLSSQLDSADCATFQFDLQGPTSVYGEPIGKIIVQPGDTLDMFTTLDRDKIGNLLYREFKGNSESAQINKLLPELKDEILKGVKDKLEYGFYSRVVDEGVESMTKLAIEYANFLDSIATSEEVRKMLQAAPLSTFGKDLTMLAALTDIASNVEELNRYYYRKRQIFEEDSTGRQSYSIDTTWVAPNYARMFEPLLKHKDLLYDNPLVLSSYDNWFFISRSIYTPLFNTEETVKDSNGNYYDKSVDKYGLAGTFMWNLRKSQNAQFVIDSNGEEIQTGQTTAKDGMELITDLVAMEMAEINNEYVAKRVLNEYRKAVRKYEAGAKDDDMCWTDEQKALWQKLTQPYAGNVLFIDFWGMACGPCRVGMIEMRDKVEAMKDEPMRFLYVCDEATSPHSSAEKWMGTNDIKGEHIYVTSAEWSMLEAMFNFKAIPHAVLAGSDGKVIQNGFSIHSFSIDDLKALVERLK